MAFFNIFGLLYTFIDMKFFCKLLDYSDKSESFDKDSEEQLNKKDLLFWDFFSIYYSF